MISSPVFANEADRSAIEAAAQRWVQAFNEADADAMAALASEDIVLMGASPPPISGRAAAGAAWRRALPDAGIQLASTTKDLELAGDVAWRIAALAHRRPDQSVSSRGQALEIWKRAGGAWKLHRQMSSGLLARQPLLRRPLPSEPVLDPMRN